MTTSSYKFGNGKLILGTGPGAIQAQVTACQVTPSESVNTIEAIPLLDNTEIPKEEEAEYSYVLSGKLLQDLTAAGIIDFSWENAGVEIDVVFVPDIAAARGVEGVIVMAPLTIGGEVTKPKNRPQSDFSWRFVGTPIFGVYSAIGDTVTEDA